RLILASASSPLARSPIRGWRLSAESISACVHGFAHSSVAAASASTDVYGRAEAISSAQRSTCAQDSRIWAAPECSRLLKSDSSIAHLSDFARPGGRV